MADELGVDKLLFFDGFVLSQLMYSEDVFAGFEELKKSNARYKTIQVANTGQGPDAIPRIFALVEMEYENCSILLVVFRGSQLSVDWTETNFDLRFTENRNGLLHRGFAERAKYVPLDFLKFCLLKRNKLIIFTGHSLGGAAAQICARNFISTLECTGDVNINLIRNKFLCLTFAAPQVGDRAWCESINASFDGNLKSRFVHVVHENDIVPRSLTLLWNVLSNVLAYIQNVLVRLVEHSISYHLSLARGLFSEIVKYGFTELLGQSLSQSIVNFMNSFGNAVKEICSWGSAGVYVQICPNGSSSVVSFREFMSKKLSIDNVAIYRVAHTLTTYFNSCQTLFQRRFSNNTSDSVSVLFLPEVKLCTLEHITLYDGSRQLQLIISGEHLYFVNFITVSNEWFNSFAEVSLKL